ncbi:MAG: diguanylate cyclase domain-containing protein [Candidatus Ornithomonoglobus sp.]
MIFKLRDVFDEYSNPIYIIRPIVADGTANDFEYAYVNNAFCLLLGLSKEELTGHRFLEYFSKAEPAWMEAFVMASSGRKHFFVDTVSTVIGKKMYTEIFHVDPDMCGCIIHNFKDVSEDETSDADIVLKKEILKRKADRDSLTGFYSRFYLDECRNEISQKENVGITYLDINHLKAVNLKSGRKAGDALIKRVSNMLRSHYKNSMIFRFSGDEFIVITENCAEGDFIRLSENGRKIFGADSIALTGYKFYRKIENLKDCIDQCRSLMENQKKQYEKN